MRTFLVPILLLISAEALCKSVSGIVFIDANGNGSRDKNETGVAGVSVSDQVSVVQSNADGAYRIQNAAGFGFAFISVPSGYKSGKSFYFQLDSNSSDQVVDFPLVRTSTVTQFSFVHASDTHISEASVGRTRSFLSKVDSIKPDFVLVTGDLIKDALRVPEGEATRLYELYQTEISKSSAPVWNVPGNHEIFGIERHLSLVSSKHPLYGRKMYRHYFGPDYYSFNFGGIHFVALNSLEFEDLWYYGSIDSVQREWLKKDLAMLNPSTPVVTFQHVPFISGVLSFAGFEEEGPGRTLEREKGKLKFRHVVSNADEVIAILRTHPFPLALGGHHHARQLFLLETEGQQTRFEQTSAVVGPTDAGGLKVPSGITVYRVKDGKIDKGTFVKIH